MAVRYGTVKKGPLKTRNKTPAKAAVKHRDLEATRRQILLVAFETFFMQGFQGTSMDDLVKKTTLTKGAFYHQFPTKLALGYAVVDEVLTQLILDRWITPLEAYENPVEGILVMMQRNIGDTPPALLRYGCPLNNLVQEMAPVDKGFGKRLAAALQMWVSGLQKHLLRAQQAGFIRPGVNVAEAAHFIVMAHEGFYGILKGMNNVAVFPVLLASMQRYFDTITMNHEQI